MSTLRVGADMGLRLWRRAYLGLNYERVVAKRPASQILKQYDLSLRQFW